MKAAIAYISQSFHKCMLFIRKYVYLIPPIQLAHAFILSFCELDSETWIKIGNIDGFSIATGVIYITHFCYTGKYCLFTKIASWSCLSISILNFITACLVTPDTYGIYENLYAKTITIISALLWAVLILTKKHGRDFNTKISELKIAETLLEATIIVLVIRMLLIDYDVLYFWISLFIVTPILIHMEKDQPTILTLLNYMWNPFKNIPQIIKDFKKENHYKHVGVTIPSTFLVLLFMNAQMHLKDVPELIQLLGAYFFGYGINFVHEWWFARKVNVFSWNDIYSGAWSALSTTLIYNFYV